MPDTPTRRAVAYLRLSRSTDDSESDSIARQRADLQELAKREGWEIVAELVDDGVSGGKSRANADEALRMLRDGEVSVLLCWKLDRWSREGVSALGKLVEAVRSRPSALFVAYRDGLRSDQQAWPIIASVLAEVARMEAANTSTRVRAMRADHLSKLAPTAMRHLGGVHGFGYRVVPSPHGPGRVLVHDPYEAAIVRDLARRFIAGERLSTATAWLDREGVPTPTSPARRARQAGLPLDGLDRGRWRVTTVRNLFRSETLLGRTTRRVDVLDAEGRPVPANTKAGRVQERRTVVDELGIPVTRWEPILDPATFAALGEVFTSPGRRQARYSKSWLTGVVRCASCGSKLYVNRRRRADRLEELFRCSAGSDPIAACSAPASVTVDRLEAFVEGEFLGFGGHLAELAPTVAEPDAASARELADVSQAIADTTAALGRDGADVAGLVARLEVLKARRRELLTVPAAAGVTLAPTGRTLADMWAERGDDFDARRELLAEVIDRVEVAPCAPASPSARFDPSRVRVVWNGERVPYLDA